MSRFRNLSPEVQSIIVAITGTVAGTVISSLVTSKKTIKVVLVVLVLAILVGIWISLQRYFGGGVYLPLFDRLSLGASSFSL